tara:strand:- start:14008 stop:14724 length:717 start_codon:yes stop_codon:yes gene_type:complete
MEVKLRNFKNMLENDYVSNIYNSKDKPFTVYPKQLIKYLVKRYKIQENSKILEIGCGRGEFINEFVKLNLIGYATDESDIAKKNYPNLIFSKTDLTIEKIPYKENFFDVIYSKSVIEHFYYPEKILKEAYRVLKPGGIIITLTPDWEFIYKSFYEDFTHRTPFTSLSLRDIHLICGFKEVKVEKFKQLPILWNSNKLYNKIFSFLSFITRVFTPERLRMKTKWIRFSKEIMLLSSAIK